MRKVFLFPYPQTKSQLSTFPDGDLSQFKVLRRRTAALKDVLISLRSSHAKEVGLLFSAISAPTHFLEKE